jgi:hypothetical protein
MRSAGEGESFDLNENPAASSSFASLIDILALFLALSIFVLNN